MGIRTAASLDQGDSDTDNDDEMLDLVTRVTNEVSWYMRERDLTRADLAARMGVSPGRVSQILGGGENLTLRTLHALSKALGARFDVELTEVIPLKGGDSDIPAKAKATPHGNHRTVSRAAHRLARRVH
jgi:transcriptional regulator with XRE-family HTH domain